ncbi:UDP-glucose 4-epimerase GalE [Patescibacteria group bacterium]|nr:UDP-glucose 4-epimerase GalE [Patescibacteria group bacterium]
MNILVTGGAGYIGAITNRLLAENGHRATVFDNLSTGHAQAVGEAELIRGDLTHPDEINAVFGSHQIDAVVHFAALALAPESMEKPYEYYRNNIAGGINLLEAMRKAGCKTLVFSSSCAVYGTPETLPVAEDAPIHPESVYASTKRTFEEILVWYDRIYGVRSVSLRYFNAAGAALDGSLGEDHSPETHIIPVALAVAQGKLAEFPLYGNDYPTPDGTCIRDYIHVVDLAEAHIKAIDYMQKQHRSDVFNLGVGHGYSNNEILSTAEKITGKKLAKKYVARRPGDPAMIYADNLKARTILGWQPVHSDLETIIGSAWQWENIKSGNR